MSASVIIVTVNISFIVSVIFFFFSLIQLIHKKIQRSHYLLSITFFAVAVQYLSFWLYFRVSPIFEKYFYFSDSAFLFLIGPFLYMYFLEITAESQVSRTRTVLNASPFFLALILIEGINLAYPSLDDKAGLGIINFLEPLSYLSMSLYIVMIFRILYSYYWKKNKSTEIKTLLYIIVCCVIFSFVLMLSALWRDLQLVGHIAFFCIPMVFIFFLIRYPDFFVNAQKESQELRYLNSQLGSINKESVIAQLDSLMDRERIYRDSTLCLKQLSSKLGITSSQLSELLNSHYKTSFNNYVNFHRVEEVKKALRESPDISILQTAFDNGFNSKTTFNTAFKKFSGLSPSQYRGKKHKKRSDL